MSKLVIAGGPGARGRALGAALAADHEASGVGDVMPAAAMPRTDRLTM